MNNDECQPEIFKKNRERLGQISKLFKEWEQKSPSPDGYINHQANVFIRDGIIDSDGWFFQDCRPLFLLKEAYGGKRDWRLTSYVRSVADGEKKNRTWRNIAMWTYGILHTHADSGCLPCLPIIEKRMVRLPMQPRQRLMSSGCERVP